MVPYPQNSRKKMKRLAWGLTVGSRPDTLCDQTCHEIAVSLSYFIFTMELRCRNSADEKILELNALNIFSYTTCSINIHA